MRRIASRSASPMQSYFDCARRTDKPGGRGKSSGIAVFPRAIVVYSTFEQVVLRLIPHCV
ncbi:hypothetical protein BMA10399_B1877 [Burkholderia mallei ATCC 10399]|nr:hypothetical protein BMA10399_B1877 [Burkholderia mallei ATCC 10399]